MPFPEPFDAVYLDLIVITGTFVGLFYVFRNEIRSHGEWPANSYLLTLEVGSRVMTFVAFLSLVIAISVWMLGRALDVPAAMTFGDRLLVTLISEHKMFLAVAGIAGTMTVWADTARRWQRGLVD